MTSRQKAWKRSLSIGWKAKHIYCPWIEKVKYSTIRYDGNPNKWRRNPLMKYGTSIHSKLFRRFHSMILLLTTTCYDFNPVPFIIRYSYALSRQAHLHLSNKIHSNCLSKETEWIVVFIWLPIHFCTVSWKHFRLRRYKLMFLYWMIQVQKGSTSGCVCVFANDWWSKEFGTGSRSWNSASVPYPPHSFSQVLWLKWSTIAPLLHNVKGFFPRIKITNIHS